MHVADLRRNLDEKLQDLAIMMWHLHQVLQHVMRSNWHWFFVEIYFLYRIFFYESRIKKKID